MVLFDKDWLEEDPQITTELLLWLNELNAGKALVWIDYPACCEQSGYRGKIIRSYRLSWNIRFQSDSVHYHPRTGCLRRLLHNSQVDICYILGTPQFLSEEDYRQLEKFPTIVLGPTFQNGNPPSGCQQRRLVSIVPAQHYDWMECLLPLSPLLTIIDRPSKTCYK